MLKFLIDYTPLAHKVKTEMTLTHKSQLTNPEFLLLQKKLRQGETLPLQVASDSMYPLLKVGQLINIEQASIESLKAFDLVVYWEQGRLQCHFLWHRNLDGGLITRSLKNPTVSDPLVSPQDYLGKVAGNGLSLWQKAKINLINILKGSS